MRSNRIVFVALPASRQSLSADGRLPYLEQPAPPVFGWSSAASVSVGTYVMWDGYHVITHSFSTIEAPVVAPGGGCCSKVSTENELRHELHLESGSIIFSLKYASIHTISKSLISSLRSKRSQRNFLLLS